MTTDVNYDNNSNNVAPSSEDFNFKGFPYVISVLGQDYGECNDEDTIEKIKIREKIEDSIDKIAEKCTSGWWRWKKSVIPLFILFDSKNKFIKKLFDPENSEESFNSKRKDGHIVLYTVDSDIDGHIYIQRYNDTNKDFDPKFDDQEANKKRSNEQQRQLNEFIVQHSHLSIIFNDKLLDTEADINNAPDDSLIWAIRYKLEGYPGSLYQQEQSEKITYPAIGPILRIVKDNLVKDNLVKDNLVKDNQIKDNQIKDNQNNDDIETYFYPSREPITKQEGKKSEEFNSREPKSKDYITSSCKIDNNEDFTEKPEIKSNLEILNIINRKSKKHKTDNVNNKYSFKDLALGDNIKKSESKFGNPNSLIQRLIAYSKTMQDVTEKYQKWTTIVTKGFCLLLLFILSCNAGLICINDILITKYGVNIFQIWGWWTIPQNLQKVLNVTEVQNFKLLSSYLVLFVTVLVVFIVACCAISYFWKPHQKYHWFQTLADCLRIQAYWKFAGMDDNVSANFRSHQMQKTDWLSIALNGLNIITIGKKEDYSDDNIKVLDKVWLEDRMENEFEKIYKKTSYDVALDSLSVFNKCLIVLYDFILSSALGALFCFIVYSIEIYFKISVFISPIIVLSTMVITCVIAWTIKKIFQPQFITLLLISGIVYGCLTGIFELWRLSSLCYSAQVHNQVDVYTYLAESFRLWVQLLASFILVAFLYMRMQMFDKERRRIEQLRSSFNVADYSLDIILTDKNSVNKIAFRKYNENKDNVDNALDDIIGKNSFLFTDNDIDKHVHAIYDCIDTLLKKYHIHDINDINHDAPKQDRTWKEWFSVLFWGGTKKEEKTIENKNECFKNTIYSELRHLHNNLLNLVEDKKEQFEIIIKDENRDKKLRENAHHYAKEEFCQQILRELGQEVLAKRIDWLLDVNDRDLKSPK